MQQLNTKHQDRLCYRFSNHWRKTLCIVNTTQSMGQWDIRQKNESDLYLSELITFSFNFFQSPTNNCFTFSFFSFFLPVAQSQTDVLLACTSCKYSYSNPAWILLYMFISPMHNSENIYQNWDLLFITLKRYGKYLLSPHWRVSSWQAAFTPRPYSFLRDHKQTPKWPHTKIHPIYNLFIGLWNLDSMEGSHNLETLQGSLPGRGTSVIQRNRRNSLEEHQHSEGVTGVISANSLPVHGKKESRL